MLPLFMSMSGRMIFTSSRKGYLYASITFTVAMLTGGQVDVRWSDRQHILPGHVAQKIGHGASRCLVIRRCPSSHTEKTVRDDLEHIHNLEVVKLEFIGDNCFISTNAITLAMYARTCMMSRLYVHLKELLNIYSMLTLSQKV